MVRISTISLIVLLALPAQAQVIHEVTKLAISPGGEDYSPVPLEGGFVMCSVREAQSAIAFRDAATAKPLSDLYWVPFRNGQTGLPVLFSNSLTTPVNEGPATFHNEGRKICYTRNINLPKDRNSRKNGSGQLGLYFSDLVEGVWQDPVPFRYNSQKHSFMHPSYSASGDTLYFASDMEGGYGGMDLYCSIRNEQGWSEPTNLGIEVNSAYNEAYPQIHSNGSLHFASDRPGGMGDLDLYETSLAGHDWQPIMPMPAPLNSSGNDFGYVILSEHTALMSSDRDGMDGIYLAKRTVPKFRDCIEQRRNNYCYTLKARQHAATSTLPLDHYWDLGDGERIKGLVADHCYSAPGSYVVRSMLIDRKTGSIFQVLRSHTIKVEDLVQAFIASPDTIRTGRKLVFDPRLSRTPDLFAAEHHWNLGDGTIKEGLSITHQYHTAGTYVVKLDILGAPGHNGSIRNHCSTKQIVVVDRFREQEDHSVTAVYQDAIGNTHSFDYQELPHDQFSLFGEEVSDSKFAVELFRTRERISLDDARFIQVSKFYRVMERYEPTQGMYIYSVGETSDLEELYKVFQKVKELDFLDAEVFVLHEEKLIDLSRLSLATLEELQHSKLSVNSIHFAYKSAQLEPGSEALLTMIVKLLEQYPELRLVIEAHTDDIGGRAYNIDLSEQRSRSVMDHLLEQGIDAYRMVAIGHGKNQPVASNRTEAGRAKNRRVEFRMILSEEQRAMQGK